MKYGFMYRLGTLVKDHGERIGNRVLVGIGYRLRGHKA